MNCVHLNKNRIKKLKSYLICSKRFTYIISTFNIIEKQSQDFIYTVGYYHSIENNLCWLSEVRQRDGRFRGEKGLKCLAMLSSKMFQLLVSDTSKCDNVKL